MAHLQLVKQTSSGLLLPATPESGDFLRSVKIGEWISVAIVIPPTLSGQNGR
ncbi:hypothetical protein DN155_23660, partial [Salmonella enterica subsp. enterica serovar Afula]|nr:hypothetical protein [Salmonella enterica subsp. enterica serovar Afula]